MWFKRRKKTLKDVELYQNKCNSPFQLSEYSKVSEAWGRTVVKLWYWYHLECLTHAALFTCLCFFRSSDCFCGDKGEWHICGIRELHNLWLREDGSNTSQDIVSHTSSVTGGLSQILNLFWVDDAWLTDSILKVSLVQYGYISWYKHTFCKLSLKCGYETLLITTDILQFKTKPFFFCWPFRISVLTAGFVLILFYWYFVLSTGSEYFFHHYSDLHPIASWITSDPSKQTLWNET